MRSFNVAAAMAVSIIALASTAAANVATSLVVTGQPDGSVGEKLGQAPVAFSDSNVAQPGNTDVTAGGSWAAGAGDLRTGTLRAYSQGVVILADGAGGLPVANVSLGDTIVVSGPTATVTLTATLDVDGSFEMTLPTDQPRITVLQNMRASLSVGPLGDKMVLSQHGFQRKPATPDSDLFTTTATPADDPDVQITNGTTDNPSVRLVKRAVVTIGQNTTVGASLQAGGSATLGVYSIVNFGSTARLSFSLPDGYTWKSASGVLLSQLGGDGLELPVDGGAGVQVGGTDGGFGDSGSSADNDGGVVVTDAGTSTGAAGSGTSTGAAGTSAGGAADGGTTTSAGGSSGCALGGGQAIGSFVGLGLVALFAFVVTNRRRARP